MAYKTRIAMEVGGYNAPDHYAVIGTATEFYIWCKPVGKPGRSSEWFKGNEAFKHFHHMKDLVTGNRRVFISYLMDLYRTNASPRVVYAED